MKILYLTGDTRIRASAFSLFLPLYRELKNSGMVDIKEVNALTLYGDGYKKDIFQNNNTSHIRSQLDVDYANEYDIIVLENPFPYWNERWKSIRAKRVVVLGDLHRFNPSNSKYKNFMFRLRDRYGIDAIFTKYIQTYERDYHTLNLPVFHWPHSVDINIFRDYGMKKKYDVLSTGMLASRRIYPIRRQMHDMFSKESYYKSIDRPNNRTDKHPNPWPVDEDYAKEINKANIAIACTSVYNYTIAKIFEIPACHTALLCDYTDEMKSLGYIPDVNFIKYKGNNTIGKVEKLLKDKDRLNEISANGYEMVRSNHNTQQRVREFIEYCKEVTK
jgi:hypothetical protein